MIQWKLNRNISLGFFIAFVVLIGVGIFSYYSLNRYLNITRNELQTRKVLGELENVMSYVKDIETGQRGFVITGDIAYLEPYNTGRILIEDEIEKLRKDYEDKERIDYLKTLLAKKIKISEEIIKIRKTRGEAAALYAVKTGEGKKVMDEMRYFILQAKEDESIIYEIETEKADRNASSAILFIISGNLMALSFLVIAVFLLNRDIGKLKDTETELNIAINIAEQAKEKEEQFLANMSHEIRTPMNAILGMTNLLLKTPLIPKQEGYLTAIKQASENLMVIINEILDFSKIKAGKIDFEMINFNLSDIFHGLYNTFKIKTDEKNLKLNVILDENLPDSIIGDSGKLNQVLVNLIGNSIKFTSKGSIDIGCMMVDKWEDNLLVQFYVTDTGIGIPENKLSTIFEDFAQAASDTARKFGGTGLGLSISKKIVELQRGKIDVKSKVGQGTTFSFELLFKIGTEKPAKRERTIKANTNELHGIKILLVDDNEFNRVVAVDTLNSLIKKLTIDVAENGKIAIEKLQANKSYDIILMDIQMPEMNGYETTEYIRANEGLGYKHIPIIAMTASATKPEIDKCFSSGMNDFVSKPFDANILLIKISTWINKDKIESNPEPQPKNRDNVNTEEVDLTFLRGLTGGNPEQMLKYINMFLDSVPGDWERLKTHVENKNWQEVRSIAHSMKPRLNYMGIKGGGEIIKEIEHNAAEEVNLEFLPDLIGKFESIMYLAYKKLENEKQLSS